MLKHYLSFFTFSLAFALLLSACQEEETASKPLNKPSLTIEAVYPQTQMFAQAEYRFMSNTKHAEKVVWDFGDGSQQAGFQPTHVYQQAGDYRVTCTAFNGTVSTERELLIRITPPLQNLLSNSECKTWRLESIIEKEGETAPIPQGWNGLEITFCANGDFSQYCPEGCDSAQRIQFTVSPADMPGENNGISIYGEEEPERLNLSLELLNFDALVMQDANATRYVFVPK